MKIYTEVNYEFQNGVLVEQSSNSYNYTGEISLCKGPGGSLGDIATGAKKMTEKVNEIAKANIKLPDKPTDLVKKATDTVSDVVDTTSDIGSTVVEAIAEPVAKVQENISNVITDNPITAKTPDASIITDNVTGIMQDNPITTDPITNIVKNINDPLKDMNVPDATHATSLLTTGLGKLGENITAGVQGIADPIIRNINEGGKVVKKAVTGEGGYADEDGGDSAGPTGSVGGGTGSEEAVGTMLTQSRRKDRLMGRSYHTGSGTAGKV